MKNHQDTSITKASLNDSVELSQLLVLLMSQEEDFCANISAHQRGIEMIIQHPETGTILCIKEKNKIIGMIGILYSISTALGAKVATFEDFIILPEYRQRGYGSQLFAQAIKTAQAAQCERITLLTDKENTKAQAFYKRQGMQASAMLPFRRLINQSSE